MVSKGVFSIRGMGLFSCISELKLGLQLRCTGLLENNIKALLHLHGAD